MIRPSPRGARLRKRVAPQVESSTRADAKAGDRDADAARGDGGEAPRRLSEEELKQREARTLFLANVPLAWNEKRLRRAMRDALGTAYEGSLKPIWFRSLPLESRWSTSDKMRRAGRIKGAYLKGADSKNAYVVVDSAPDVGLVAKVLNNFQVDNNHTLRADGVGEASVLTKFDRKRSVHLGGLPHRVTEADIRWVLSDAGEVDAVRIVRNKITQENQGFAFARFTSRASVKAALNLWRPNIRGKEVWISRVEDESSQDSWNSWQQPAAPHPATKRMEQKRQQRLRQK
ncbi:unnamed protein product, partial [Effrenium voratum]